MGRSIVYWLFFSVVISLLHLITIPIIYKFRRQSVALEELMKDGSLIFFAATLSATSLGDYLRGGSVKADSWTLAGVVIVGILLLMIALALYGGIVATLAQTDAPLDAHQVFCFSCGLSVGSVCYGLTIQLLGSMQQVAAAGAAK